MGAALFAQWRQKPIVGGKQKMFFTITAEEGISSKSQLISCLDSLAVRLVDNDDVATPSDYTKCATHLRYFQVDSSDEFDWSETEFVPDVLSSGASLVGGCKSGYKNPELPCANECSLIEKLGYLGGDWLFRGRVTKVLEMAFDSPIEMNSFNIPGVLYFSQDYCNVNLLAEMESGAFLQFSVGSKTNPTEFVIQSVTNVQVGGQSTVVIQFQMEGDEATFQVLHLAVNVVSETALLKRGVTQGHIEQCVRNVNLNMVVTLEHQDFTRCTAYTLAGHQSDWDINDY